jgi:hypothetical protein
MTDISTISEERLTRHGKHLFAQAISLGWVEESMEGPYEFVVRKAYEQGLEDGEKGRCDALGS